MTFEIWLNDSFFHYDHGKAYHEYGRSSELSAGVCVAPSGAQYLTLADPDSGTDKPLLSYYNIFGQESRAASPAFFHLMPKLQ